LTVVTAYRPGLWPAKHSGASVRSLAVLPFLNAGADPDWDYLADGVTESMINRLSRIRDLRVMSRSAVFRVKKMEADPIEQGRRLKVDAVLTGSIHHFPDHLEASVELVDCATGNHIWGEQYRQVFVDPLMFEKSAVEDTATQLRERLDSSEKQSVTRNYTANLETYRLYLKGRYEWNKRNVKASEQAIRYFKQALDLDPSYAVAWAGIADAYSFESGYLPASEIFPKAQAAALKSLELDPDLAEAHASLGFIYVQYGWDWARSEAEFRRARQLNPNYPSSHSMYARLLTVLGRFPEAEAEVAKAQALDPLSPGIAAGVALEYYLARDYSRAEKQLQNMLRLDPSSFVTNSYLALTHVAEGKAKEAVLAYERLLAADPNDLLTMADLVRAYSLSGRPKDANELMERIKKSPNYATLLPTSMAEANGALGRLDAAFAELDRAFSERCWYLIYLNVEPIFDPLRHDPRFRVMQRKMALAS
jgi:TolB-like protein/Tfp pilus assembly protein PilF